MNYLKSLPNSSRELILNLEKTFKDEMVLEDLPAFERGKKAGVIELIKFLRGLAGPKDNMKDISANE